MSTADGQKIAKKLSLQISKETKKIKELLPEFNACQSVIGGCEPLRLEDALDPSELTTIMQPNISHSKRELIDAYLIIKRADEELSMVAVEMTNTLKHYEQQLMAVKNCIEQYRTGVDAFSRGAVALLQALLVKLHARVSECHSVIDGSSTTLMPLVPGGSDSDSDSETSDSGDEDDSTMTL